MIADFSPEILNTEKNLAGISTGNGVHDCNFVFSAMYTNFSLRPVTGRLFDLIIHRSHLIMVIYADFPVDGIVS